MIHGATCPLRAESRARAIQAFVKLMILYQPP
jgi:hypothetical protein